MGHLCSLWPGACRALCQWWGASQEALVVKNPPANAGEARDPDPWVRKTPWRRKRQPTPVFLLGESHGQRGLVGDSPWGHKELDVTEVT